MKSALLLFKARLDETAVIEFLDKAQLDEIRRARVFAKLDIVARAVPNKFSDYLSDAIADVNRTK